MKTRRALWRRRAMRPALCLLAGAVTAVGVAWAAAAGERWPKPRGRKEHVYIGQWPASVQFSEDSNAWETVRVVHTRNACLDPDDLQSHIMRRKIMAGPAGTRESGNRGDELPLLVPEALANPNVLLDGAWRQTSLARRMLAGGWGALPEMDGTVTSHAFGWPARCLWGCSGPFDTNGGGDRGWVVIMHRRWRLILVLPTTPAPAGFAINTAFFAVPWWILLVTPGAVKRWRRRRHGACIACGYDLRGLRGADGSSSNVRPVCPECGRAEK